jgi:hypothetical protein
MRWVARLPGWTGLLLVAVGATSGAIAWQVEGAAADDLARAVSVQESEVPESDAAPPEVAQYRAILDVLDESIEIRRDIDESLSEIEGFVSDLDKEQSKATAVADTGRGELARISDLLRSAAGAARATTGELRELDGKLAISVVRSRAIAHELEELDESLGPSLGDINDILDIPSVLQ